MSTPNPTRILVVDDDDVDVEGILRALKKTGAEHSVEVAHDGLDALEILRGDAKREPLKRPYLVLLDLNMPRMNGIEFLEEVRTDNQLKDSVIFVLTTSNAERDKIAAYNKQVAGYIVKEKAGADYMSLVTMLERYWQLVELPPRSNSN